MPQEDAVAKAVADSKRVLANATKFTQNVEGNPTSSFAPKKIEAPHIPQVHPSAAKTPYSLAHKPSVGNVPGGNSAEGTGSEIRTMLDAQEQNRMAAEQK